MEALGIDSADILAVLKQRGKWLVQIYPNIQQYGFDRSLAPDRVLNLLWTLWLPLALQLVAVREPLNRPLVQGILGGQGTGKTTLCGILTLILEHLGYATISLSLDDLYQTYAERQHLQQQDPRFRWRGPPGTHDLGLGINILEQLCNPDQNDPIPLPRFDKSAHGGLGDRAQPEWVTAADVILFEGWFVGVQPLEPALITKASSFLKTEADQAFVQEINRRLRDYRPLWERLDRLMMLWPQDYRLSRQWRQQAEDQAIATGKSGMSAAEVAQFVEYFWRTLPPDLFLRPMRQNPQRVELVIEIEDDHLPVAIYRPESPPSP